MSVGESFKFFELNLALRSTCLFPQKREERQKTHVSGWVCEQWRTGVVFLLTNGDGSDSKDGTGTHSRTIETE